MKKIVCLMLAALFTLIFMSASLAEVEASYSDGVLTVSTNEEGFWEITVDTEWIGHWIGSGHPSYSYPVELEPGEHTVIVINGSRRMAASFQVSGDQTESGSAGAESKDSVKLDNVSYDAGVVKFQVSGLRAYAEIWIDGQNTGHTVREDGEHSVVKTLGEGAHTLALYVPAYDEVVTADFSAADFSAEDPADQDQPETETPADSGAPSAAEVPADQDQPETETPAGSGAPSAAGQDGSAWLENVVYATGVVKFQVSGLPAYAEIWIDGVNTGLTVRENGEQSVVKLLAEGTHTLALYVPASDEMDIVEFSAVDFIPQPEALREILPYLVKNEAGENLGSGLAIDRDENGYLLRVSVIDRDDAVLLLTGAQIRALLEQGLNVIEYVNGNAALYIDLTKVSDAWFDTQAHALAFCFILLPGENGTQVTVYALTTGGEAKAAALSGITLVSGRKRIAVKQNGVY